MVTRLEQIDKNHYQVAGEMVFACASDLLSQAEKMLRSPGEIHIDLSRVNRADSAGLAVVLEWFRLAHAAGVKIHLEQVPEKLDALARICEVHGILGLPSSQTVSKAAAVSSPPP